MYAVKHKYCSFIPFGKTGVGKSTFLNSIPNSNQFLTSSSAKSCTKEVSTHQFHVDDKTTIISIDNPGLYDDKGEEEDQKHMKNLTNFLRKFEYGINGIGIVISTTDCRLNSITKKSIKLLYQFIGNDLWSHLCIIVTHCPSYQEDLNELKRSMTSGKRSLRSSMIQLIKGISHNKEDPPLPFFFVDSKHPEFSPSRETLPIFKEWLLNLSSIKTNNLNEPDVKYQYKLNKTKTETNSGKMCPIYKYERGPTKYITVTKREPVEVTKTGHRTESRLVEKYESRGVDAIDIFVPFSFFFRNNKKKITYWEDYEVPYEYTDIEYRDKQVTEQVPGDWQKVLKGYHQEIRTATKTWTAYWDYDVDNIDESNPTYETNYNVTYNTTINYYNNRKNLLSPYYDSLEINNLKALI